MAMFVVQLPQLSRQSAATSRVRHEPNRWIQASAIVVVGAIWRISGD
jgi:hypothetical protein